MQKNFVFLTMLLVLVSLAIWQVFRLDHKTSLINQIQYNKNLPPLHIDNSTALGDSKYRKVQFSGKFISDKTIFYYRLKNNVPGFEVITPVSFDDKNIILVSRGWVEKQEKPQPSDESIMIEGYLMDLYKQNVVSPGNNWNANELFGLDIEDIERHLGIKCMPYILILSAPEELKIGDQDLGFDIYNLPNNHLGYAIIWSVLAIILVVIFIIDFKKRRVK